jgi:hypothetical protein
MQQGTKFTAAVGWPHSGVGWVKIFHTKYISTRQKFCELKDARNRWIDRLLEVLIFAPFTMEENYLRYSPILWNYIKVPRPCTFPSAE